MKKIVVIACLIVGCEPPPDVPNGNAKMEWRDGFQLDASLREAKTEGKPLMLYFTASW